MFDDTSVSLRSRNWELLRERGGEEEVRRR